MCLSRFFVSAFNVINGKLDTRRLAKKKPFEKVEKVLNIPYLDSGNKYHLLDIYYPEGNTEKLPVIIDIHGGAWMYGTKDINAHYCQGLATYGFIVVNISYRIIKEGEGGTFPNIILDVLNAFNWVEKNIESYNGDLNNVFLTGDSAGAHLASLAQSILLEPKLKQELNVSTSIKFNALALTCGVFNLEGFAKSRFPLFRYMFKQFFGKDYKDSPYLKLGTIKNNKLEEFPPIFLNTCYGDFMKKQVFEFYEECKKRNVVVELNTIDKKRVNNIIHVYSVLFPEYEESIETTDALIAFFKKHIV
ncbi:MAG: alpha/beta hydrolase [Clostridiales bacterium]|jgi:acetyl esterase/lipase|nr:alpha/beta hydrolase [Clostridiales bacterium]